MGELLLVSVAYILGHLCDRVRQETLQMCDVATQERLQQFKDERAAKAALEFVNANIYQRSSFCKHVASDKPFDVVSWY